MRSLYNTRVAFTYVACLMLACFMPLAAYAEEPALSEPTQTVETQLPVATEAQPATTEASNAPAPTTTPESDTQYTYDAATGRWNTNEWQYDPVTNTYVEPPKPVVVEPSAGPEQSTTLASPTSTPETGAGTSQSSATMSSISNVLNSLAQTGDSGVSSNTSAGDALSGDALSSATIINNVNSTVTNSNNTEAATFVTDIMGDVNGDILLQPLLLKAMIEANAQTGLTSQQVTNQTGITNDVNLGAQSGDASVTSNTSAGNATTGSANTVADVVNIVNSMVAANQSFIGTVNIYGNLNGDILIAPDFIPQMLQSNAPVGTDLSKAQLTSSDTQTIVNNVSLAAESGTALVMGNTTAGNALTGDANTNLVIFNLTGHDIVASNSLLVFVNVLGTWVGVIVDAPAGATAAAIADGVTTNAQIDPSLQIDVANEAAITNNLNLNSKSGDATVASNTKAGNATTGDATASANIANISNSQIGLTGWFGVLFINVFGSWFGSFGVDTAAGNPVIATQGTVSEPDKSPGPVRVMEFIPREGATNTASRMSVVTPQRVYEGTTGVLDADEQQVATQASESTPTPRANKNLVSDIPQMVAEATKASANIPLALGSLLLTGISLFLLRRVVF